MEINDRNEDREVEVESDGHWMSIGGNFLFDRPFVASFSVLLKKPEDLPKLTQGRSPLIHKLTWKNDFTSADAAKICDFPNLIDLTQDKSLHQLRTAMHHHP
eukprot:TRINITY_DN9172_c0_g1_i8.p1 TRINITY_DN9172_c0_g1~~TRINITY_DN9172_c0_g1_i8.p1  ORF type:complete len:102 (+),score=25.12 TRINITY_DN9172_c0_g1_i8:503-808(+)